MEAHHDRNKNDILLNTFLIRKKKYRVLLHYESLVWEKEKASTKNGKLTVPLTDILAVRISTGKRDQYNLSTSTSALLEPAAVSSIAPGKYFINIHYVKRDSNNTRDPNRWRKHTIALYNADYRIVKQWYDSITATLAQQKRPKNILMFINPYGGRRKAMEIYEKYSKPLLQLAGIDISCVVSQRPNQIRDILLTQSLDQYDGVCCVGGDGTFSEVFNGLIQRSIRDLDMNPRRPEYLPKPRLPTGIIPAGSTNTVAYCLHGTIDIKTTVIHIILGRTRGLDLSSVCNHMGLVRLFASVMGYGYLGDVALDSERFRWMGPTRYEYSGFKKIFANRGYEFELIISQEIIDEEAKQTKCNVNCVQCPSIGGEIQQNATLDYTIMSSNCDLSQDKWKTIRGKYFMIAGANISCACSRSPRGFAPFCHLGDGYIDIIMIRHTSIFNILRLLIRLSKGYQSIDSLPFVEVYRTKKFFMRSQKSSLSSISEDLNSMSGSCQPISPTDFHSVSHWNCDGEIIHDTDVLISSHRQLVDVFMQGSYPEEERKANCCGFCIA